MTDQTNPLAEAPPIMMLRDTKNRIRIRKWTSSRVMTTAVFAVLIALTGYTLIGEHRGDGHRRN